MDADRWRRIDRLLDAAFGDEPGKFERLLREVDPSIAADVHSLLAAEESAPAFLEGSVAEFIAPAIPDGLRAPQPLPLAEGTRIGRFRVVELIGRGGMGSVYRAWDEQLERDIALKFLTLDDAGAAGNRERFLREARAAAAIDHRNVATVHDVGVTDDGRLYIAMAYYAGETLKARLQRGPVPRADAIGLAIEVARGLAAAHEKGIVHRDIKPANLLLTPDGGVRIVDFGIARRTGLDGLTIGPALGTIAYMSPEQAEGRPIDHRTDLWSLGVVLYEMLTGRTPFQGDHSLAVISAILYDEPAPLGGAWAGTSIEAVVRRLLQKEPDARYASAHEVIEAFSDTAALVLGLGSPRGLPEPATSFIGREREIATICALLDDVRLVTLTGPGGTGKTRLALQVAARCATRLEHGVVFVSLAAVTDPALVAPCLAAGLGLGEAGGISPDERLLTRLRGTRGLIVLDNFEHVREAAPLLSAILEASPGVRLLVTSRAPLRIRGERVFPVPPLAVPDDVTPGTPAASEAVRLFEERGRAIRPDFSVDAANAGAVTAICRRLEGLPLAIELAVARLAALEPAEILGRLERRLEFLTSGTQDAPARHRTLRDTIAWSYELLAPPEQWLFRRLAVFTGGHSLDDASAVCRAGVDGALDILDPLQTLVESSLVRREVGAGGRSRYAMLETIREFALDQLSEEPDAGAAVRRAHRDRFLALAESAAPELTGPDQTTWLERLGREHENLRAALDFSLAHAHDADIALRFGAALWRFWLVRGHLWEGASRMAALLGHTPDTTTDVRARALVGAGTLAHNRGRYREARSFFQNAHDIYRQLDDDAGLAHTLNNLAWVGWRLADYEVARTLAGEGLALHRARMDRHGIATAINNLAWIDHYQGDYENARARFDEVVDIQRERGDARAHAFALSNLAWTVAALGDHGRARSLLEQALGVFATLGDRQLAAFTRARLGAVLHTMGETTRAVALLRDAALVEFRSLGDLWGIAFALDHLAVILQDAGELDDAAALIRESLALRRDSEDRWGIARCHARLAALAEARGDTGQAVTAWEESLQLRERMADRAGTHESRTALDRLRPAG